MTETATIGRFRFTLVTIAAAVGLAAWGAFVTSIDAGLAVPDWPTSFQSYDPFNPWPGWWRVTPVLAEHGHRLAGALVGLFTLILAIWTWRAESRRWLRILAMGALALVIAQGILGGLRVVLVSLNLAVVHACVAQIFFSLLAGLALFTSQTWHQAEASDLTPNDRLSWIGWAASGTVFVQIILGALLRHPGTGIDLTLASLHIGWAFVATGFVVVHAVALRRSASRAVPSAAAGRNDTSDDTADDRTTATGGPAKTIGTYILVIVALQVTLGFVAYIVLLDERGMLQPSNLQVIVNSLHLVLGATLLAMNVVGTLLTRRIRSIQRPA